MRILSFVAAALMLLAPLPAHSQVTSANDSLFVSNGVRNTLNLAPDSVATAWCVTDWSVEGNHANVNTMYEAQRAIFPVCPTRAVFVKRPMCYLHAYEVEMWFVQRKLEFAAMICEKAFLVYRFKSTPTGKMT